MVKPTQWLKFSSHHALLQSPGSVQCVLAEGQQLAISSAQALSPSSLLDDGEIWHNAAQSATFTIQIKN